MIGWGRINAIQLGGRGIQLAIQLQSYVSGNARESDPGCEDQAWRRDEQGEKSPLIQNWKT